MYKLKIRYKRINVKLNLAFDKFCLFKKIISEVYSANASHLNDAKIKSLEIIKTLYDFFINFEFL